MQTTTVARSAAPASAARPLKIAVLVSPARHPVSGKPLRSVCDAAALELACTLAPPERLTVLCAGMVGQESLRDYLGLGAIDIEVLSVMDADAVLALTARLRGYDLVLCGARADGQSASGMLPYLLAEELKVPMIGDVLEAQLDGAALQVRQFMPKGLRRRLEVDLPAVLAVHQRAPLTRQFAFAHAAAGRVRHVAGAVPPMAEDSAATPPLSWQIAAASRRPRPLKAKIALSGHSRMLGAIGGDMTARGGRVIKDGDAQRKAQAFLDYLREHKLVNF